MSGEIKKLTSSPVGPILFGSDSIRVFQESCRRIRQKKSYIPVPDSLHNSIPTDTYGAIEKLKKLLPFVLNKWKLGQETLFKKSLPRDWEKSINELYEHIWKDLPNNIKNVLIQVSKSLFGQVEFNNLAFEDRLYLLNGLRYVPINKKSFYDWLLESIVKIDQGQLNQIKYIALALYGDKKINDLLPSPIIKAIEESFKKHLVEALTSLKVSGLEFSIRLLGRGYVGMAFLIELDGSKFVLKLPIAPKSRANFKHFQYEQKNLNHYEEILQKYADQNPPEQDFIPRLIYDAQGQPLSQTDEVTVTKYYQGEKLNMTKGEIYCNDENFSLNEAYIRSGLDDDFLLDFIDFYLRFAREGADLGDITLGNFFHNGASLAFFELAGLDPDTSTRYKDLKRLREASPMAACIFTLLTAISTLEQPKVSERYGKFLRQQVRASEQFGAEDFFVHRIGQLVKVFEQAIDKSILNRQELKQGIDYLHKVCSRSEVSPNIKISKKGLEYLGWLKAWVEKSS